MTDIEEQDYAPVVEERAAAIGNVDFDERIISIVAVPWEQSTRVEYRNEVWNEVFTRGAFDGIQTRQSTRRIPATAVLHSPNVGHEGGHLVGKVCAAFPDNPDGLGLDILIADTLVGEETLRLANKDMISPSIGFKTRPTDQQCDRRSMTRRINRAFLDHLAFVSQPAYTGAKILGVRDSGRMVDAAKLPPLVTPALDEFLADPIFGWAANRFNK